MHDLLQIIYVVNSNESKKNTIWIWNIVYTARILNINCKSEAVLFNVRSWQQQKCVLYIEWTVEIKKNLYSFYVNILKSGSQHYPNESIIWRYKLFITVLFGQLLFWWLLVKIMLYYVMQQFCSCLMLFLYFSAVAHHILFDVCSVKLKLNIPFVGDSFPS